MAAKKPEKKPTPKKSAAKKGAAPAKGGFTPFGSKGAAKPGAAGAVPPGTKPAPGAKGAKTPKKPVRKPGKKK